MEPNYYEALGVPCDASNAEISRAYQKKVMDEESPVSDEEFMVLAEALDVLTDPDTRKLYDLENGIRPNAPGDDGYRVSEDAHEHANPQDFFYRRDFRRMRYGAEQWIPVAGNENYYGPFPSSLRPNVPLQQDPPVVRDLRVSLEDVFHGCTKRMRISQKRFDPFRGVRRTFHNTVKIEVKPGWKEGARVVFPRQGDENPGKIPADIVFILKGLPHKVFTREGNDIILRKTISLRESLVGCDVEVPTLEGEVMTIQFPDVITPETTKILPQRGLPVLGSASERGDLILKFTIKFPQHLDDEQKRALKRILPS